jgi:actin-related protein
VEDSAAEALARRAREEEERRRWEAADRARIEAEERLRAKREIERQEAEERERTAAAEKTRWEQEQRAQLEAQMRAEAAAAEQRETERLAKEETRQRGTAPEERERQETEEKKRARSEHVAKVEEERQRVVAELLAKAKSDQESKAREEAETKRRAHAEAEARKRAVSKAEKESKTRQKIQKRETRAPPSKFLVRAVAGGILALLFAVAALLPFIPFNGDKAAIEKLVAERTREKVTIGGVHVGLFPLPHVILSDVVFGEPGDIKIDTVTVPWEVIGGDPEKKSYKKVELDAVAIRQTALVRIPGWTRVADGNARLVVGSLALKNVRLTLNDVTLDGVDGEVTLSSDGSFVKASLFHPDQERLKVEIVARDGALAISFSAKKWRAPLADALVLGQLSFKGTANAGGLEVAEFDSVVADGSVKGRGRIEWGGPWKLSANLEIASMEIDSIAPRFTRQMPITGRLDAKLAVVAQGDTMQTLFAAPRIEGEFVLANGSLGNIDLMKAIIESPNYEKVRGGQTFFKKFAGTVLVADQRYQWKQLSMVSGSLTATGNVEVASNSALSGKANLELGAEGNPVKDTVAFSGNVKEPSMRPSK